MSSSGSGSGSSRSGSGGSGSWAAAAVGQRRQLGSGSGSGGTAAAAGAALCRCRARSGYTTQPSPSAPAHATHNQRDDQPCLVHLRAISLVGRGVMVGHRCLLPEPMELLPSAAVVHWDTQQKQQAAADAMMRMREDRRGEPLFWCFHSSARPVSSPPPLSSRLISSALFSAPLLSSPLLRSSPLSPLHPRKGGRDPRPSEKLFSCSLPLHADGGHRP